MSVEKILVCVCCSSLLSFGEGPSVVVGAGVGSGEKNSDKMAMSNIVVSVNGVALTREGFDDLLDVKETFFKIAHPNAKISQISRFRTGIKKTIVTEYVSRTAILQLAKERKHIVPETALVGSRAAVCVLLKTPEGALDNKLLEMGRVGVQIKKSIEENAIIKSYREKEFASKLQVTEADILMLRQRLDAYRASANATNQLVCAKAKRVCEELGAGGDFFELAKKYSEEKGRNIGKWGVFLKGEIENEEVRKAAFSLPVGGCSKPIETDEGLVVVKVLAREGAASGAVVAESSSSVTLGRILFRMVDESAYSSSSGNSREDLVKMVTEGKNRAVDAELIAMARKQAVIEFPNGTNFWAEAINKRRTMPREKE